MGLRCFARALAREGVRARAQERIAGTRPRFRAFARMRWGKGALLTSRFDKHIR